MYIKKIEEFINDNSSDDVFEKNVITKLKTNKSIHDDQAEEDSWRESLPEISKILTLLPSEVKKKAYIVLEAKYQVEEKRADVVIVGTYQGNPRMLIIENKRWSQLEEYAPFGDDTVVDPYHDSQILDHPCRQVEHYRYTLANTNKFVQDSKVEIFTAVFLQNALLTEKQTGSGPFDGQYEKLWKTNPIFVGEEIQHFADYISLLFDGGAEKLAEDIYESTVQYSAEYRSTLANMFGNREQLKNLLDSNQIEIFDEIMNTVKKSQVDELKRVYIIEGKPGTGKTFVAIALLAYLYQEESIQRVKYILKNKDPRNTLLRDFNIPPQAISWGLKGFDSKHDCLICDEAHRMLESVYTDRRGADNDSRNFIDTFIELSNVSVFFYDKKQSVHVDDYVKKEIIEEKARNFNAEIICKELKFQHRCPGADSFLMMIENILDNNMNQLISNNIDTCKDYEVGLVNSPEKLMALIREKNNAITDKNTSRVLAGKGRNNGVDWSWDFNNTCYDSPKTIAPHREDDEKIFTWNFGSYKDKGKWETFASDQKSEKLVGCIDTSQGLDFQYIGVIIARDLYYDELNKRVMVSLPNHQQADPNTRRGKANHIVQEAVIKNAYRVLLSRGIKGCYIYCMDEALQTFLANYIPTIADNLIPDYIEQRDEVIIGNSNIRNYHKKDCKYAPTSKNKRIEFKSVEEARAAGYKPCEACNPLDAISYKRR